MKKGEIVGLGNSDDSMWYRFIPKDHTLIALNEIFGILDTAFDFEDNTPIKKRNKYSYFSKNIRYFKIINKELTAYFIFDRSDAHLILRKVKKWEKYDKEIGKRFDFKVYEWKKVGKRRKRIEVRRK